MYLKCHRRFKDGKEHRYWSIAEKRRVSRGRVVDRHILYLGEINDTQREAWLKTYRFIDLDQLMADFERDIARWQDENGNA
jgi:hypothetical protein